MPYVGEIRLFASNFPPIGWAFLDGQELPISENETLYVVIGTQFGGDGESTFRLPNLMGRVPMGAGNGFNLAEMGGVEAVTLTTSQMPSHSHPLLATTSNANDTNPANNLLAQPTTFDGWQSSANPNNNAAAQAIGPIGGSQPHDNMQPYLCVNFIMSLFGVFPSQT